jgi:hypothetical protein
VIFGRVSNIKPLETTKRLPLSEHDPMWQETTIQIESVLKGSYAEEEIVTLFPKSTDVKWYSFPKFKLNQTGIWLLHKYIIKELNVEGYIAYDNFDFYADSQLNKINKMINHQR